MLDLRINLIAVDLQQAPKNFSRLIRAGLSALMATPVANVMPREKELAAFLPEDGGGRIKQLFQLFALWLFRHGNLLG